MICSVLPSLRVALPTSFVPRSMIEGSTRISSGMQVKQLAAKGTKGAGATFRGCQQDSRGWFFLCCCVVCAARGCCSGRVVSVWMHIAA